MIGKKFELPYYLIIKPKFKINDCQEYTDPHLKKNFTVCFKNLLIKISENEYVPKTSSMYSLEKEYRLRKGFNYYHKESLLHNYNDKTMFDLAKKLRRKKFSYTIKPRTEIGKKLLSLTYGYYDVLFNIKRSGNEYYNIEKILALLNTIIIAEKNIHKYTPETVKKYYNDNITIYPITIASLILFPTRLTIKEKKGLKIIRVNGHGNLGYNCCANQYSNVRLSYNYDEYSTGLIITENSEVLIP